MDLHEVIAKLAGEYPGKHAKNYQTQLFFGVSEQDVEQQMISWRLEIQCPPGGGLALWWRDEWITDDTLLRYVAYEPREAYEQREQ